MDSIAAVFQKQAGTGDQAVSFPSGSWTPKGIIFFWGHDGVTALDTLTNGGGIGLGLTTGASESFCASSYADDGVTTTNVGRTLKQSCIILLSAGTPTEASIAALVSFDAGGFTINWSTNSGTGARIGYIAFGGSDLTNCKAVALDITTDTGNQSFTSAGFQPDFGFFFHAHLASYTTSAGYRFGFGCARTTSERWAYGMTAADAITMEASQDNEFEWRDDACVVVVGGAGAETTRADFVSWDTNGLTLNRIASSAHRVIGLFFKGGNYKAGNYTKPTSGGPVDQAQSSFGFQPAAIFRASIASAIGAATVSIGPAISIGAASSSSQNAAAWVGIQDAIEPTVNDSRVQTDRFALASFQGTSPHSEAVLKTLDSGGYTETWDPNNNQSVRQFYIAFGPAVTGVNGSLSVTLAAVTPSGAGTVDVAGAVTKTLTNATSSAAGAVDIVGVSSPTLADVSIAAAGITLTELEGELSQTLADSSVSSAGAVAVQGSEATTLEAVSSSAAGQVEVTGAASQTLAASTLSGTAEVPIAGSAAPTIADSTTTAAGVVAVAGLVSGVLDDASLSAEAGAAPIEGELAAQLEDSALASAGGVAIAGAASPSVDVSASGAGVVAVVGQADITFAGASQSASGQVEVAGAAASLLEDAEAAAAGTVAITADASPILGDATLESAGELPIAGSAAPQLEDASALASGAVAISGAVAVTIVDLSLEAAGSQGGLTGQASATLESLQAASAGAVLITGAASPLLDLNLASEGSVLITGQSSPDLAAIAATGAGQITVTGALSSELESASLSAAGAGQDVISGALDQTLGDVEVEAGAAVRVAASANIPVAAFTVTSDGQVFISGELAASITATATAAGRVEVAGALAQAIASVTLTAEALSVIRTIPLALPARNTALGLGERSRALTIGARSRALTLSEHGAALALSERDSHLTLPDRGVN